MSYSNFVEVRTELQSWYEYRKPAQRVWVMEFYCCRYRWVKLLKNCQKQTQF